MKQITFRLKPGQLLKEEVERVATEQNIQAGIVLSMVGSLTNAVLRMAGSTSSNDIVKVWEEPFEITAATGTISPDGCHIHVSLSRQSGDVIGGHLKNGCKVWTTAEVVLGVFEDVEYRRILDINTGFKELDINTHDQRN